MRPGLVPWRDRRRSPDRHDAPNKKLNNNKKTHATDQLLNLHLYVQSFRRSVFQNKRLNTYNLLYETLKQYFIENFEKSSNNYGDQRHFPFNVPVATEPRGRARGVGGRRGVPGGKGDALRSPPQYYLINLPPLVYSVSRYDDGDVKFLNFSEKAATFTYSLIL